MRRESAGDSRSSMTPDHLQKLNPTFGDWAPWFDQIVRYWDAGGMTQLCMLSPAYAFTLGRAKACEGAGGRDDLDVADAYVLRQSPERQRDDLPHMIVYMAPQVD